ncbi:potassium channel family protein [Aeromicrobium panaciterrae]|uniref:potassium channel family protein n=1 Tax=Aeromicrobium panaciterrae TaxID=363861 RepID=UPI0031DCB028
MFVSVAAVVVLLAGGGFAAFESEQVSSYGEGVWWALSLMSTVGFVGEAPESTAGRLVSSILMISGFALMALVTASIASLFVREEESTGEATEREFEDRALALLDHLVERIDRVETRLDDFADSGSKDRG